MIPPLLIGSLGTVGTIALYFTVPGFQFIDLLLLLVVVAFAAAGYGQGILRGVMTAVILYISTGIAALFYRIPAPYIGTIGRLFRLIFSGHLMDGDLGASFSENATRGNQAFSFVLLTAIIWVALEALARVSFRDTRLPRLGFLDNASGVIFYLLIGFLVASLLFNAIGYGRLRQVHNQAWLRPRFNQALALHVNAQAFWFPRTPPPIYIYDLDT